MVALDIPPNLSRKPRTEIIVGAISSFVIAPTYCRLYRMIVNRWHHPGWSRIDLSALPHGKTSSDRTILSDTKENLGSGFSGPVDSRSLAGIDQQYDRSVSYDGLWLGNTSWSARTDRSQSIACALRADQPDRCWGETRTESKGQICNKKRSASQKSSMGVLPSLAH